MKLSPVTRPFDPEDLDDAAGWSDAPGPRRRTRIGDWLRRRRWVLLLVVLPTLLVAGYEFGIAADQYVSESKYLVRGRQDSGPASLLGAALSSAGFKAAEEEATAVRDYLQSLDAVRQLRERVDLVAMFRRPEADPINRLWYANPQAERLLRYYDGMVQPIYDSGSGVTTLRVRAFRPEDAREINEQLMRLSEDLVNRFSDRTIADTLRVARDEVALSERRVVAAREAITQFRQREESVDPSRSAVLAQEAIGRLEGQLSQSRAEMTEKQAFLRPDNPQMVALRNRIDSLAAQVQTERRRLTTGDATLAQQLGSYERLLLEREFADRQLASATSSLEGARADAQRQHLFLVRVVQPNLAEYPLFPKRWSTVLGVFIGLVTAYAVGWLLLAGVREHAA